MVSALEFGIERSIHSYSELNTGVLCGPTTCSDPVGIVECLIHESQDCVSVGGTIFGSRHLIIYAYHQ